MWSETTEFAHAVIDCARAGNMIKNFQIDPVRHKLQYDFIQTKSGLDNYPSKLIRVANYDK